MTSRLVEYGMAQTLDPTQEQRTAAAPLPTAKTLRHRKNLFVQIGSFIMFNMRFMATFLAEKLAGDERIDSKLIRDNAGSEA